ncbi:MAG: ATP-dependent RNA helicase HrpA [bacterium]
MQDATAFSKLEQRISQCPVRGRRRLQNRLLQLMKRAQHKKPFDRGLKQLSDEVNELIEQIERRRQAVPAITYPESLPVSERKDEILEVIKKHPVTILAGETGSGKTTQLPKICLEAGLGVAGMIACTQPRRIAAHSVANRIAEELGVKLGLQVGYQVRFTDQSGPETLVKLMTDGILLQEIHHDPLLLKYDCIILDEAHERSLNIDFLLGFLKTLLKKRHDLKVIVTSATIDTQRFSEFFGQAPVIEVSGRTWPVELRYLPLLDEESGVAMELNQGISEAIDSLAQVDPMGDVLVFLSGEREILDAQKYLKQRNLKATEILPLYGRLSMERQGSIFKPGRLRRIILSTNVAETSLTVPRIRFVIDSGLARISHYSQNAHVQRLPIEAVSQASANQRAGRCGRLGPGVCIRLYSEEDYLSRDQFSTPEILRTSLAAVILKMFALKLGEVEDFPFLEPPPHAQVRAGVRLLDELGAFSAKGQLGPVGQKLARMPVDVRIGRILLAAAHNKCLHFALPIAALLSMQDPRERPLDFQQAADQSHKEFATEKSDFMSILKLWDWFWEQRESMSHSQLRKLCVRRFINYRRMLEWRDLVKQLREICQELKLDCKATTLNEDLLHQSLLVGYLGQVAMKDDEGLFQGPRGQKLIIFPGSNLSKKPPAWIMAGEFVETSRVFARTVAEVQVEWIEKIASHLIKRHYFEPWWSVKQGQAMVYERVTLFGLPLVEKRARAFAPMDAKKARELFLLDGLVRDQVNTRIEFIVKNRKIIQKVKDQEDRFRRRDLLADEQQLLAFYENKLPASVHSIRALEKWLKKASAAERNALLFTQQDVLQKQAGKKEQEQFPAFISGPGYQLKLSYYFEPGQQHDGVLATVPVSQLNQIPEQQISWLVPGLLRERIEALLRTLPKPFRRMLVPVPECAQQLWQDVSPGSEHLHVALAALLKKQRGVLIAPEDFDEKRIANHLRMQIRLIDQHGKNLEISRDLSDLQQRFGQQARQHFISQSQNQSNYHKDHLKTWDFGELPEQIQLKGKIRAYPALVDLQGVLCLRSFDSPEVALNKHRDGLQLLFKLTQTKRLNLIRKKLPVSPQAQMVYAGLADVKTLSDEFVDMLVNTLMPLDVSLIRSEQAYAELEKTMLKELGPTSVRLGTELANSLLVYQQVSSQLRKEKHMKSCVAAIQEQLDNLVYPGFLLDLDQNRLAEYSRYLEAAKIRLQKVGLNPLKDSQSQQQLQAFWDAYIGFWEREQRYTKELETLRWLIEEYRVSLFAQPMKTKVPVSAKRLTAAVKALK